MTDLFGGFHPAFYAAYEEARPLEAGYRERFPIYNLYHLLNHLNLFGRGYYRQLKSILDRFAA
jgi:fructosamine-3-kinase